MSENNSYHHHHNKRQRRKNIIRIIAVAIFLVAAVVALILIYRQDHAEVQVTEPTTVETDTSESDGVINYNGQNYVLRDDLEIYLLMGIDRDGEVQLNTKPADAGQCDLLLLAVIDDANQSYRLLQINRDSMTDVTILGILGDEVGTEYQQICLAHAYGNGEETSCMNVVNTVSNLLDGIIIDGYVSLNVDGIAVINDAVGGVTVTIHDDFSDTDPTLVMGETVTLMGEHAEAYVRGRRQMGDPSNLNREVRQREYLQALAEKALDLDSNQLITIFDEAEDYIVTDMGSKSLMNLFDKLRSYTDEGFVTIEGESFIVENVNQYELDQDSLQQTIIDLFCVPVE